MALGLLALDAGRALVAVLAVGFATTRLGFDARDGVAFALGAGAGARRAGTFLTDTCSTSVTSETSSREGLEEPDEVVSNRPRKRAPG